MQPVPMRLRFVTDEGIHSEDMELGERVLIYGEYIATKVYDVDWFVVCDVHKEPSISYAMGEAMEVFPNLITHKVRSKRRRKYWEPPKYF